MSLRCGSSFWTIENEQLKNVIKLSKIEKKEVLPLKCILALPTWGQICTVSVLQPFTFDNFQSEQPVVSLDTRIKCLKVNWP